MDSEHRHELHSNEMEKFIQNFPKYVKENYLFIIGLCLIVGGVITYGPVQGYFKAKKVAGYTEITNDIRKLDQSKGMAIRTLQQDPTAVDTSLVVTATELEIAASNAKNQELSAMAFIKRAEAIRAGLHYTGEDVEKELVVSEIEKARKSYKQAISKAAGDINLVAKAEYGLGLCAEEVGDYAGAEEIYSKIIDNADFACTIYPVQAKARLDKFSEFQQKYVFADAPKAAAPIESLGGDGAMEMLNPVNDGVAIESVTP